MAKINEFAVAIKVSKLLKDNDPITPIMDNETIEQLVAIIQELSGEGALVEMIKLDSEE